MTDYYCPKCHIVLETKSFDVSYSKPCWTCSTIMEPVKIQHPSGIVEIKARVKVGGHIWQFNRTDKDPNPSKHHGHDIETGEKLDMENYITINPRNGTITGKLKEKEINEIKQKLRQQNYPIDS